MELVAFSTLKFSNVVFFPYTHNPNVHTDGWVLMLNRENEKEKKKH